VLSADDGITGIDLDHCRDPESGVIAPWAYKVLRTLNSYTEVTPSATGFRVFVRGKLPGGGRKKGGLGEGDGAIEIYDCNRYLTVTGESLAWSPPTIEQRQGEVEQLIAEFFKEREPRLATAVFHANPEPDDEKLIELAMKAANGAKFRALWIGDSSLHDGDESAGDQALVNMLAFWTGKDEARIDRLFRQSGRYRDKWDERHHSDGRTYGQGTIAKAMASVAEVYSARDVVSAATSSTSPPTNGSEVGGQLLEASGAELIESAGTYEEPPCLPLLGQPGYIIEGWSNLIAGYPRIGKTELIVSCIGDWLEARRSVLYVSEEPRSLWERRLARCGSRWNELKVVFGLGADPPILFERAFTGTEEIVVIDTMRNLLQLRDETDNSEVARVLNPWIAQARSAGKTLLVIHHMRKGSGEHGEGIAGGHALLGVFDVALELLHDRSHHSRRVIRAYARLVAPPNLAYEREDDGFKALGAPSDLELAEVMTRATDVLTGSEWLSTQQVRDALGEPQPSLEQLRKALIALADAGSIERNPSIADGSAPGKRHMWRLRLTQVDESASAAPKSNDMASESA
jgi:hypothetical protein